MDTNKMKLVIQETNIQNARWKSADFRANTVKRITETMIKLRGNTLGLNLSELIKRVERFEEQVNSTAKNEAEYIARITAKLKEISQQFQSAESKPVLSSTSGSATIAANKDWQEEVYQKVQRMKNTYFTKLYAHYQQIKKILQQHESSQGPKTFDFRGFKERKKYLEYVFVLFRVSKSQITTEVKEKVDKAEMFIHALAHQRKNVSSHHQGNNSADMQSKQPFVPSQSKISPTEILETKPSPQALGTQNYHFTKQIPQQKNMRLQEQQVTKQYSNSQQDVNQVPIITSSGKAAQQQTHHDQQATEAFGVSVNTLKTSASTLNKDCNDRNEISLKSTLISDEPSAAMQYLIKVLGSISPEALSAAVSEIRDEVYFNDISMPKFIDRPLNMAQQQNQPSLIPQDEGVSSIQSVTDSNLAYDIDAYSSVNCNDFVPTERKMSRSIDAIAFDTSRFCASTHDSFNQMIDAEEPDLTCKGKRPKIVENYDLLEEIKKINRLLIDSEVVIDEKDNIESAAERALGHGEGIVVKFLFNAVTVNQNLFTHYAGDKKSIIKPLWLLVPTSYPLSSPIILDKMPLEVSEDLKDLSVQAEAKFRSSLQIMDQPWSLGDIAMSWEHYAREAILEYGLAIGGGTFSSKYGEWEMSQDSS